MCLLGAATVTAQSTKGEREQNAQSKSNTLQRADKDMRAVLEQLQQLGAKPIHTLTVEQARTQPTPADAVKELMSQRGQELPPANVRKENVKYSGAAGELPARIYIPGRGEQRSQPLPVIVYYHGGGWVIADLDTYDASATALAQKANAIVVAAEYRHAPEHKFPAAHEDAFAAYRWALDNARQWGGDPQRVAIAGESAGGNLAINVAIKARDENVQSPVHMLLVYPVAGTNTTTPSYRENANAMPLGRADMQWFIDKVLADPGQKQDPRLDVVGQASLKGLPPATVITAEIDPLRSEGRALADKLRRAGSDVTYRNYEGVTHEFFGMASVVADAARAQDLAARELRQAFTQGAATGASEGTSGRGNSSPAAKQDRSK